MELKFSNFHAVLAELQKRNGKKILFLGNGFSTGFKDSSYSVLKNEICQRLDVESSLYQQLKSYSDFWCMTN